MEKYHLKKLWPIAVVVACIPFGIAFAGTINYTYDDAGRLIRADYGNGKEITYTYDNAGNLLRRSVAVAPTLADAIRVLQIIAEDEPPEPVNKNSDISNDDKIGLEEAIYILQKVAGLR